MNKKSKISIASLLIAAAVTSGFYLLPDAKIPEKTPAAVPANNVGLPKSCVEDPGSKEVRCDGSKLSDLLGNKRLTQTDRILLRNISATNKVDLSSLEKLTFLTIEDRKVPGSVFESVSTIPGLQTLSIKEADMSMMSTPLSMLIYTGQDAPKLHKNFTAQNISVTELPAFSREAVEQMESLSILNPHSKSDLDLSEYKNLEMLTMWASPGAKVKIPAHLKEEDREGHGAGGIVTYVPRDR